jgi:hypothetical protein
MSSTSYSIEGALYELVARGNKDVYFIQDDKESKNLFDNRYNPVPPQIAELRRLPPLNQPGFGRSFEFQVEIAGDLFIEPTLLIDLPSWLPPPQAALNPTSRVSDASGVTYGYTNGIGYFLFEKIQLLQDNILLQEFSGDALWATSRSRGTLNSAFLDNRLTGLHSGTPLEVGRNATPGRLRLPLPLFGCQSLEDGGFPACCIPQQQYRIRCFLRKLEDLVEASDGRAKPAPWAPQASSGWLIQSSASGPVSTFSTLPIQEIQAPSILLETRHIYTDAETRLGLQTTRNEIPFERLYENIFTQNQYDYAPIERGAVAAITRRLEGTHPAARIVNFFRSKQAIQANQLWKISNDISGGEFYNNLKLIIAGKDRETLFSPLVWRKLVVHAKEERDPGLPFAIMNWTVGDVRSRRQPFARQPEGSVNFTTADRPTLYLELNDIPVGSKNSVLHSIVETWAAMVTEDYRATLWFAN